MNQKTAIYTHTVTASGDVSTHRFVGFDGAQVAAIGGKVLGASTFAATNGQDLAVDVIGTTVVETAGAIDAGDDVVSDADGKAIVNPEVGGEIVVAVALDDAAGAGEFIEVLLVH